MTDPAALPTLFMPRRLAIHLLQEAQIAADHSFAAAIGAAGPPREFSMLPSMDVSAEALAATRLRFDAQRCVLWAVYLHRPDAPTAPTTEDFAVEPDLLRLTSSLATKGVLQLRAWRLIDGRVVENQFHVED